tara:strand:- start:3762 stop:4103 length:342 start_codon:yes stop_codon:yes gene_type:complete
MPVSRYDKNKIIVNSDFEYKDILKERGVNQINHYSFEKLKRLKVKDIRNIDIVRHTWESSDRFFKLAAKYYSDPSYWWIIAYFNNTPLETDVSVGETLLIPIPLSYILSALDY